MLGQDPSDDKGAAMKPPTMAYLLEDPAYRRMFKTIPHLPPSLEWGNPWSVWARRVDGGWRGGNFPTYRDGWAVVVKALRSPVYEDVAIISRRMMFEPPGDVFWEYQFEWCCRCRRPTSFAIRPNHHARRNDPAHIVDPSENRKRCYYCGMRQVAMPIFVN